MQKKNEALNRELIRTQQNHRDLAWKVNNETGGLSGVLTAADDMSGE